jgi:hypothetical protein
MQSIWATALLRELATRWTYLSVQTYLTCVDEGWLL